MMFFDIVKKCILADVSMALYSLPDDDKIFLIIDTQKAKALSHSDLENKNEGFVFHPYKRTNNTPLWFIAPSFVITSEDDEFSPELLSFIDNLDVKTKMDRIIHSDLDKISYLRDVNGLIEHIKDDNLKKVVYSRTITIDDKGINDALEVFSNLESHYKDAFVFFVNITHQISWLGATPELLLSFDDEMMHTMALAGTQRLSSADLVDVKWDQKDIKEQEYVCDYIDSKLLDLKYTKGETITLKAGDMCHLQTKYTIDANTNEFWHIIKSLHPTPAVCGLPVGEALKAISYYEKHDRAYYSGFLGPINIFSTTAMFVNLRSARVYQDKMQLFVGGGITADSCAEKEWEETRIKSKTIINIL